MVQARCCSAWGGDTRTHEKGWARRAWIDVDCHGDSFGSADRSCVTVAASVRRRVRKQLTVSRLEGGCESSAARAPKAEHLHTRNRRPRAARHEPAVLDARGPRLGRVRRAKSPRRAAGGARCGGLASEQGEAASSPRPGQAGAWRAGGRVLALSAHARANLLGGIR